MFGGGKCWRIWPIASNSPNFTLQINDVHYKESKQAGICQSFTHQKPKASEEKFTEIFLCQTFTLCGIQY